MQDICSIGMCTCTKQTLLSSRHSPSYTLRLFWVFQEHVLLCNRSTKDDISHVKHIKYTQDNFLLSWGPPLSVEFLCWMLSQGLLFLKPFRTKIYLRAGGQTYFKFFKVYKECYLSCFHFLNFRILNSFVQLRQGISNCVCLLKVVGPSRVYPHLFHYV